ncbi:MAG: response regulator transcription factor [Pseudomonadota bacterium]
MSEAQHLLVVDDDDRIRSLLKRYLATAGYRVTTAPDAKTAKSMMVGLDFDLAILDIMMPGEDGLSLLASLRETNSVPVILLTARDLLEDRLEGLRKGADDYLSKPFDPEELTLRIAAILRRTSSEKPLEKIRLSGLVFDPTRGDLREGDRRVHLTEGERHLLTVLATRLGRPVERQELFLHTGGNMERSIDVQVTRLRRKIEPNPKEPIHLQTVRGVGYKLISD